MGRLGGLRRSGRRCLSGTTRSAAFTPLRPPASEPAAAEWPWPTTPARVNHPRLRQYEEKTTVHYRHPGRYRLHRQANAHVHRPRDVLQVYDGEREWTYVAADREAYVQAAGHHELVRLLDPFWAAGRVHPQRQRAQLL
jgi:hypothetical protein